MKTAFSFLVLLLCVGGTAFAQTYWNVDIIDTMRVGPVQPFRVPSTTTHDVLIIQWMREEEFTIDQLARGFKKPEWATSFRFIVKNVADTDTIVMPPSWWPPHWTNPIQDSLRTEKAPGW